MYAVPTDQIKEVWPDIVLLHAVFCFQLAPAHERRENVFDKTMPSLRSNLVDAKGLIAIGGLGYGNRRQYNTTVLKRTRITEAVVPGRFVCRSTARDGAAGIGRGTAASTTAQRLFKSGLTAGRHIACSTCRGRSLDERFSLSSVESIDDAEPFIDIRKVCVASWQHFWQRLDAGVFRGGGICSPEGPLFLVGNLSLSTAGVCCLKY